MTDELDSRENRTIFSRRFGLRMLAISLFIGLGTFAVSKSIKPGNANGTSGQLEENEAGSIESGLAASTGFSLPPAEQNPLSDNVSPEKMAKPALPEEKGGLFSPVATSRQQSDSFNAAVNPATSSSSTTANTVKAPDLPASSRRPVNSPVVQVASPTNQPVNASLSRFQTEKSPPAPPSDSPGGSSLTQGRFAPGIAQNKETPQEPAKPSAGTTTRPEGKPQTEDQASDGATVAKSNPEVENSVPPSPANPSKESELTVKQGDSTPSTNRSIGTPPVIPGAFASRNRVEPDGVNPGAAVSSPQSEPNVPAGGGIALQSKSEQPSSAQQPTNVVPQPGNINQTRFPVPGGAAIGTPGGSTVPSTNIQPGNNQLPGNRPAFNPTGQTDRNPSSGILPGKPSTIPPNALPNTPPANPTASTAITNPVANPENNPTPGMSPAMRNNPSPFNDPSPNPSAFNASSASPPVLSGSGRSIAGNLPTATLPTPGDNNLEGIQTPMLAVEKVAPAEIQLNQPAKFSVIIRNIGKVPATDVAVHDQIPAGTKLISAEPQPQSNGDRLTWMLGEIPAGQEKRIEMELRPEQQGEIGSVAHVTFATRASMRTRVTRPELSVEHTAPARVMIGQTVPLEITVRNNGDGAAQKVVIQEKVPEQFSYSDGIRDLEYEVGTLLPGQSRTVSLNLRAIGVGNARNTVGVVGEGGLQAVSNSSIEVIAPQLNATSDGPHRRYLKRPSKHTFSVNNSGTASATNVDLIAQLPRSLRFVATNNQGTYQAASHAVYWSLNELSPGQSASVEIETQPVETGTAEITFVARADLEQQATIKHDIQVEHLVDVHFEIEDTIDHIEVGYPTEYRLRIVNRGTRPATNVRLAAEFDPGLRPDAVTGGLRGTALGQRINFEPIATINPGEEIVAKISAIGASAGEHRVAVNLQTDDRDLNITKQESTRVYADQ